MEILGSNINGMATVNASQEPDPSVLIPESSGMNQSMDSLPLHERSYISDISDSVILTKPKDDIEKKMKSKSSSKNKSRRE